MIPPPARHTARRLRDLTIEGDKPAVNRFLLVHCNTNFEAVLSINSNDGSQ